ncbi:hypothetical protein ACRRTK_020508 [Alexandromys fortis]
MVLSSALRPGPASQAFPPVPTTSGDRGKLGPGSSAICLAHRSQPDTCPFHSPGRVSILERSLGSVGKLSQLQGQHHADGGFQARGASVFQPQ